MLCLPEFDTYHVLPKYAEEPEDARNRLALKLLKHRTLAGLQWRVLNARDATADNADDLLKFQMGRWRAKGGGASFDVNNMTGEELLDFYLKAVASVGQPVDPSRFTKKNEAANGGTNSNQPQ